MAVYTKKGDLGDTSLIGGERVRKCDARVEAYGTLDELSAFIGVLHDHCADDAELQAASEEGNHWKKERLENDYETLPGFF